MSDTRRPDFNVFIKHKQNKDDKFTVLGMWQREEDWISGSFDQKVIALKVVDKDGTERVIDARQYYVTLYDNRASNAERAATSDATSNATGEGYVPVTPSKDDIPF